MAKSEPKCLAESHGRTLRHVCRMPADHEGDHYCPMDGVTWPQDPVK